MSETWEIYKKTKHRVGFRRPDGTELRLPRHLMPESVAVGETVVAEVGRHPGMSTALLSAGGGPPDIEPTGEPEAATDRWLTWKVSSRVVGITGAGTRTGKHKLPPDLLPMQIGVGDQLRVVAKIHPASVALAVLTPEAASDG